jgi:hypothetical protein
MPGLFIIILVAGALASLAGWLWLASGGPQGRLHRRLTLTMLLALPLFAYIASSVSVPAAKGGFWPWFLLGLMMLSPVFLGWWALCWLAYWLSGRKPSEA